MTDIKLKKKIFAFGSCRVQDNKFIKHFVYGPPYTHDIKCVLQFIDYFENPNKWYMLPCAAKKAIIWKPWITFEQLKYAYEKSDIILIEISSLKLKMYNNVAHSDWRLLREGEERKYRKKVRANYELNPSQTYDELVNDIKLIKRKVSKPVLFQGHANLLFRNNTVENDEVKDNDIRITSREIIDNAIIAEVEKDNRIIINEIFGDKYNNDHWRDLNSSYHYSDKGYKLIAEKVNKQFNEL